MGKIFLNYQWRIFLLLLFPWFFLGGPGYESSRIFKEVWNVGHIIFFAIFTLEANRWMTSWSRQAKNISIILAILALATGIEACQSFSSGRIASLQDIIFGLAGGLAVVTWKGANQQSLNTKILVRALGISGIILCMIPLLLVVIDEYLARRDFPVLSNFESFLDVSRWEGKGRITRVRKPVRSGQYALMVPLTTDKYSGISLQHFPENWSKARALTFSIYNPGDVVTLHYRIHDWKHKGKNQAYSDRFNGHTNLASGWNTITIGMKEIENGPKTRKNDINHIRGFGIFVVDQPVARVFYIDDVQLALDYSLWDWNLFDCRIVTLLDCK